MARCVIVKLEEVRAELAAADSDERLIAVCAHQGADPEEMARSLTMSAATGTIPLIGPTIYEWRELYFEKA